jgi:galactokinase
MLVKPLRARAIALYRDAFGTAPQAAASAPGCVDLIGWHTSYNGGPVLPIATRERVVVAVDSVAGGTLEGIRSGDRGPERWDLREGGPGGWLAAVARVLRELAAFGAVPDGARIAVASEIREDGGLASRAALAVATVKAFAELNGLPLTARQVAGVAFRAAPDHGRGRHGIMEHTSAALAHADHALLIECASAETRRVTFRGRVLLVETGPPDGGMDATLAQRRVECDAAVLRLRMDLPELHWLASWPAAWLARLKKALPQPLRSRAVHVVSETARARFAAELLAKGRLIRFGELLYESHESCRRLFDVSTPAADLVVSAAQQAGALGARLTGAGAGGTVVVVLGKGQQRGKREEGRGKGEAKVITRIQRAHAKAYGSEAVITAVRPGDGARLEPVRFSH